MKKRSSQRKSILSSNKGFSLIEMIVVIAIMAVAVGLVTITYVIVDNANVSKAANTLDTAFNKARIQSMAKGTDAGQLTVWITGGVMYYTIGDPTTENPTAINSSVISIYSFDGANWSGPITDMSQVAYRFNSAGMVMEQPGVALPKRYEFSRGNRRVHVIFYFETGKHSTQLQ